MILPIQITFRNTPASKSAEDEIRAEAKKLETFYHQITSCRVLVEVPARHRQRGYPFHVRIDLTVPRGEIVVKRAASLHPRERNLEDEHSRKAMETHPESKHLEVAIREAFAGARRRLQDYARRQRLDVKAHEPTPYGWVTKLFPSGDYGFIETADGREIYFHANSVIDGHFKDLKLGTKVAYIEEAGEKGPQASTLRLVRKARPAPSLPPIPAARAKTIRRREVANAGKQSK